MEILLYQISAWLVAHGLEIVFLVVMVETAIFVGLLVPAEATVLLAAFLASRGYFQLQDVFLATAAGAFIGDQVGYGIGRFGLVDRLRGRRALGASEQHYEGLAARVLRRHALLGITLARFVSFVRTLMPWYAGRRRVPYGRFAVFDFLGVVGWAAASVALGYLAGESWRLVAGVVGTAGALVVLLLVAGSLVVAWRSGRLRFPRLRREVFGGPPPQMNGGGLLRVALTGNVASGKSTVARIWEARGAAVVDADELAREAVAPGSRGLRAVVDAFGKGALTPAGEMDRDRMRRLVFQDPEARGKLEAIVHPEVERLRGEREAAVAAQGVADGIVVHDIPLLFEVGLQDQFDVVVVVDAPEEVRLSRLVEERGLDRDEAWRIIDSQQTPEWKRTAADFVIDNDGSLAELERQAGEVWHQLLERGR